jgi:hypothetical protein
LWTIVGGVVAALGLGTFVALYSQETLKRLVRSPQRAARTLQTRDIVPSEGTHFTVLIADLEASCPFVRLRRADAFLPRCRRMVASLMRHS